MNTFTLVFGCVVFASLVFCEDKDESKELENCGIELEKLYNKVCDEKDVEGKKEEKKEGKEEEKKGGKKLTAIRKICFTYPPKVMKHKEIVDIMDKCNTEEQVCDKKKMSDCGQTQFEEASEEYRKKAEKEKLEEKTLPEMFANSQKEVATSCNETLVCFQSKVDLKMEDLEKDLKKKEEDKKKKEEDKKKEGKKE